MPPAALLWRTTLVAALALCTMVCPHTHLCCAGEGQQRVLSELEREFNSGLARRNRTTGLGA